MKKNDGWTMITVALGTATLTVAAFLSNPLEAGGEAKPPPTIENPKLIVRGIEMVLSPADGVKFKAGDQPAFDLHVVNTHHQPSDFSVCATMRSTSVPNPMARMIPVPKVLWQEKQNLTLGPKETRTIRLATRTSLPMDSEISVLLSEPGPDGKMTAIGPGMVALKFSTAIANNAVK